MAGPDDSPFSHRARTLLSVPLVIFLLVSLAQVASARAVNVTGTWQGAYHCEVGCAGMEYKATTEFYEAAGCGDVVGSNGSEAITGTLSGSVLTVRSETGSYWSESMLTVSSDGNHLEGPDHDSHGTSGHNEATRVSNTSAIPPYTGCKHPIGEAKPEEVKKVVAPTGMTVSCNYDELSSQDTCTAVVADASGPSATRPTGSVTFASTGGGFFPFGKTCALSTSPSAPSTGTCSVEFVPAAGAGFPKLTAAYAGDATHAPASGTTRFILPGGGPGSYDTSSPGTGYPNEVSVEVNVPAAHSEVQAGVNKGDTAPQHPAGKQLRASEDPNIVPSMRSEVEEREREERYPDIVPSMRKEVEEREIQYERDVQQIHREVNEAKQHAAGLGAAAQTEQNAAMAADSAVIAQIAQQENSADLKKDPASAAVLAKLAKQSQELQKSIGEIDQLQRHEAEGAVRGIGSSLEIAGVARAGAHRVRATGKLISLGHVRVLAASAGTVKLKIRLKRSTLARLAHGKRSLTVNLRIVVIMPSHVVKSGLPVGIVRRVTLHAAALHHQKH
jgi:hypothetical protein